jgi:hypothetical protein
MPNAEHAKPNQKPIVITVNRREVQIPDRDTTGAEIKAAAEVPPDFMLFDPHGSEIADGTVVHVHPHERFTAISGQDVS